MIMIKRSTAIDLILKQKISTNFSFRRKKHEIQLLQAAAAGDGLFPRRREVEINSVAVQNGEMEGK